MQVWWYSYEVAFRQLAVARAMENPNHPPAQNPCSPEPTWTMESSWAPEGEIHAAEVLVLGFVLVSAGLFLPPAIAASLFWVGETWRELSDLIFGLTGPF